MDDCMEQEIQLIIRKTIAAVGMELNVIPRNTGVNMMYDFIHHCILVDTDRLLSAKDEMKNGFPLNEYVQALTLHELGHALDRKALLASLPGTREVIELKRKHDRQELYSSTHLLKKLVDENDQDYLFEETAWNHAERLNNTYQLVSTTCMVQMKLHGLATYQQAFSKDRIIYDGLVAAETALIDE